MDSKDAIVAKGLSTETTRPTLSSVTNQNDTTDGHDSYLRAIREILGSDVLHRTNSYLNNRLEQDHSGIKQYYYPMRGFGAVISASRFCRAFDEVRQLFRFRTTMKQKVSLVQQKALTAMTQML
jgi:putative transposase